MRKFKFCLSILCVPLFPGCACDVPSNLYSISFEPNPNWQRRYLPQPEILDYLKSVVQKNNVESHIRYDADIVRFEFVEKHGLWKLTDRRGEMTVVQAVILAVGPFNRPQIPDIKGIETFSGKILHSARWDTNYDLTGKCVAVVGKGVSAVQIVPAIRSSNQFSFISRLFPHSYLKVMDFLSGGKLLKIRKDNKKLV